MRNKKVGKTVVRKNRTTEGKEEVFIGKSFIKSKNGGVEGRLLNIYHCKSHEGSKTPCRYCQKMSSK